MAHMDDGRGRSAEVGPAERAFALALNTHDVQPMVDHGQFASPYEALTTISSALRENGIQANIVAGGLNFYVALNTVLIVGEVLGRYGFDINQLKSETFAQEVNRAGGLEQLAATDPMGRAAQIMRRLAGETG